MYKVVVCLKVFSNIVWGLTGVRGLRLDEIWSAHKPCAIFAGVV